MTAPHDTFDRAPAHNLGVRSWLLVACLLAGGAFVPGSSAKAQLICTEPLMPICAQDLSTISEEQQKDLCVEDLQKFEKQLDEYVVCVRETAEKAEGRMAASIEFRTCLEESDDPASCEPLE